MGPTPPSSPVPTRPPHTPLTNIPVPHEGYILKDETDTIPGRMS